MTHESRKFKGDMRPASNNPTELIKRREERVVRLNSFAQNYYRDNEIDNPTNEKALSELNNEFELLEEDKATSKILLFLLEAFRPTETNKSGMYRKDGNTLVVTHSLELYKKAKEFGIDDQRILHLVLLHDICEDTDRTLDDIESLDKKIDTDNRRFASILTEDKGKRVELGGDGSLVFFVEQINTAEGLTPEEKPVVVVAELLDRIDDLSDLEYITKDLDGRDEEKKKNAGRKLIKKLAKCQFTINSCTEGVKNEKVDSLITIFNDLVLHYMKKYSIRKEDIENEIQSAYVIKEQNS